MKPRKILFLAGYLGLGGTERQLAYIVQNINRQRFEPYVMTLNPAAGDYWESVLVHEGVPILAVERGNQLARIWKVIQLVRQYRFDLLHSFHFYGHGYAALAGWATRTPTIGSIRFLPSAENLRKHIPVALWRMLGLRGVTLLLTNSTLGKELIAEQFPHFQHIRTIPNGTEWLDCDMRSGLRQQMRSRLNLSAEHLVIGLVGRLNPNKNPQLFLKAVVEMHQRHQDVRGVIIGDGSIRHELQLQAEKLGLAEVVTFTGNIAEAASWLPGLDILCQTSRSEGMPNVLLEAGGCGIPVVATDVGGSHEIVVDNQTGLLFASEDLSALVTHLNHLINHPEIRQQMGQAASDRIQHCFTIEAMVKQHEELYSTLYS